MINKLCQMIVTKKCLQEIMAQAAVSNDQLNPFLQYSMTLCLKVAFKNADVFMIIGRIKSFMVYLARLLLLHELY